jgi:hypothetical protein
LVDTKQFLRYTGRECFLCKDRIKEKARFFHGKCRPQRGAIPQNDGDSHPEIDPESGGSHDIEYAHHQHLQFGRHLFVGQISTSASGAVGIVSSLMAILQALGFMLGHGSGSIISRSLGSQNTDAATREAFFRTMEVIGKNLDEILKENG